MPHASVRSPSSVVIPPESVWTVLDVVRTSADWLAARGISRRDARLDAEHLLAHVLSQSRLQLYLHFDRPLTAEELGRYKELLLRRGAREPVQYVLGTSAFRELDLEVDPRVLIPRPETERLVQAVLDWAENQASATGAGVGADDRAHGAPRAGEGPAHRHEARSGERPLTALDVGTGSGCIALSLALEGPFHRVTATDVSSDAVAVARRNTEKAGLSGRVRLLTGPLYEPVDGERFDVVVSNPPYVARSEASGLPPEITEFEPEWALYGGQNGLDVLHALVDGASAFLAPGGLLALEVGLGQAPGVAERVRSTRGFEEPRVLDDLSGRPRIVLAAFKTEL